MASSRFCGSPEEVRKPYLIVPSVYAFSLRIPLCSLVLGHVSAVGAEDPEGAVSDVVIGALHVSSGACCSPSAAAALGRTEAANSCRQRAGGERPTAGVVEGED